MASSFYAIIILTVLVQRGKRHIDSMLLLLTCRSYFLQFVELFLRIGMRNVIFAKCRLWFVLVASGIVYWYEYMYMHAIYTKIDGTNVAAVPVLLDS